MALPIRKGPTEEGIRVVVIGQEGVGKTTLAAGSRGLFLTCEDGGGDLDYDRVVCATWLDLRAAVHELQQDAQGYITIVIDTISSFERLCWDFIRARANNAGTIEEVGGGYGKGYTAATEEMTALAQDLDFLRLKQRVHVIVLAHTHVKVFNDPMGNPYDRYQLRMHEKACNVWLGWADCVLFACFDVTVKTAKRLADINEKGKAVGSKRVLYTTKDAAYDAKNRYNLPEELPLSWEAFAKAIRWDARTAAMRPDALDEHGHHPSWAAERAGFCAAIQELGLSYDNVKAWHLACHGGKPSSLPAPKRRALLDYLRGAGKADVTAWLATASGAK
jgi:hypothetical protein